MTWPQLNRWWATCPWGWIGGAVCCLLVFLPTWKWKIDPSHSSYLSYTASWTTKPHENGVGKFGLMFCWNTKNHLEAFPSFFLGEDHETFEVSCFNTLERDIVCSPRYFVYVDDDGHVFYLNSFIKVLRIKYYDSFLPTISILTKHTCIRMYFSTRRKWWFLLFMIIQGCCKKIRSNILQILRSNDSWSSRWCFQRVFWIFTPILGEIWSNLMNISFK